MLNPGPHRDPSDRDDSQNIPPEILSFLGALRGFSLIPNDPESEGRAIFRALNQMRGQLPLDENGLHVARSKYKPILEMILLGKDPDSDPALEASQESPNYQIEILAASLGRSGQTNLLIALKDSVTGQFCFPMSASSDQSAFIPVGNDHFCGLLMSFRESVMESEESDDPQFKLSGFGMPIVSPAVTMREFIKFESGDKNGIVGQIAKKISLPIFPNFDDSKLTAGLPRASNSSGILFESNDSCLVIRFVSGPYPGGLSPVYCLTFPETSIDENGKKELPVQSQSLVAAFTEFHKEIGFKSKQSQDSEAEFQNLAQTIQAALMEKYKEAWDPAWKLAVEAVMENEDEDFMHVLVGIHDDDLTYFIPAAQGKQVAKDSLFSGLLIHIGTEGEEEKPKSAWTQIPWVRKGYDYGRAALNWVTARFSVPEEKFTIEVENQILSHELFESQLRLLESNPTTSIFYNVVRSKLVEALSALEQDTKEFEIGKIQVSKYMHLNHGPDSFAVLVEHKLGKSLMWATRFEPNGMVLPEDCITHDAFYPMKR